MEIGELVHVAMPELGTDDECPFSHEKPNPAEKNELGGIGTKLGENMEAGLGICHDSRKGAAYTEGNKELDPRKRPKKDRIKSVNITVSGEVVTLGRKKRPLPYPLTCAAHHLIPAQESLKGHEVLQYMCKKDEDQDFRKGKSADPKPVGGSKVWGNVAYNVNGCHNGVWLPGNYAVGGGTGGAELWKSKASDRRKDKTANQNWADALDLGASDWDRGDDDDEEEAKDAFARAVGASTKKAFMLAGANQHIDPGNPKWAYVKAAMNITGGQFHDRHEDYSKQVKSYLDKIAAAYKTMHTRSKKNCTKCEDAARPAKMTDKEVGPPYAILGRLKTASDFFKGYLLSVRGQLGIEVKSGRRKKVQAASNIYTSGWVDAWFKDHTG
jgi:hypothetical protein